MTASKPWNGEQVRTWLARRFDASRLDQAAADRRGYEARDEYDQAAAEEWVCSALKRGAFADDQAAFAARVKELIGQDDYPVSSIHDDARFVRHVRAQLRKIAKMTKANEGFERTLHHQ